MKKAVPRRLKEADGTMTAMEAISMVFIFVVSILRLRIELTSSTGGDITIHLKKLR